MTAEEYYQDWIDRHSVEINGMASLTRNEVIAMIEEYAQQQVKNCDLADVGGSLPEADIFEDVICEIEGEYKEMTEYRILVEPDSEDDQKMRKLFG